MIKLATILKEIQIVPKINYEKEYKRIWKENCDTHDITQDDINNDSDLYQENEADINSKTSYDFEKKFGFDYWIWKDKKIKIKSDLNEIQIKGNQELDTIEGLYKIIKHRYYNLGVDFIKTSPPPNNTNRKLSFIFINKNHSYSQYPEYKIFNNENNTFNLVKNENRKLSNVLGRVILEWLFRMIKNDLNEIQIQGNLTTLEDLYKIIHIRYPLAKANFKTSRFKIRYIQVRFWYIYESHLQKGTFVLKRFRRNEVLDHKENITGAQVLDFLRSKISQNIDEIQIKSNLPQFVPDELYDIKLPNDRGWVTKAYVSKNVNGDHMFWGTKNPPLTPDWLYIQPERLNKFKIKLHK